MIKPLANRILIRPFENSDLSDGGVYIGQATTTFVNGCDKAVQTTVGEVLAVGEGKYNRRGVRRPPDVPIGSVVTFSDTCGTHVSHEDEDYLLITEDDVVGFMDKPTTVELVYES